MLNSKAKFEEIIEKHSREIINTFDNLLDKHGLKIYDESEKDDYENSNITGLSDKIIDELILDVNFGMGDFLDDLEDEGFIKGIIFKDDEDKLSDFIEDFKENHSNVTVTHF